MTAPTPTPYRFPTIPAGNGHVPVLPEGTVFDTVVTADGFDSIDYRAVVTRPRWTPPPRHSTGSVNLRGSGRTRKRSTKRR